MKLTVFLLALLFFGQTYLYGQKYVLDNEKIIYSFQTSNGKRMTLCSDKNENYIVYRFGTKTKIELEYPKNKDKSSWNSFKYSYWLRGGGLQNEGIDLNYVAFTIENIKYVIYDTYFARGENYEIGIRVINSADNKTLRIIGNRKTQKGTLMGFRFDKLINVDDELYD